MAKYQKILQTTFSQSLNESDIEQTAKETGFVKRKSPLMGRHFLEALMFGNLQSIPASLNDLAAYLYEEHQIEISKQGLDDRINEHAVSFLKSLLKKEMNSKLDLSSVNSLTSHFSSIRIKDSTRWNLPDNCSQKYKGHGGCRANSKSMISLQFDYDLLSGNFLDLSLTSGTRNDQRDSKEVKDNIYENELHLRDLGFATIGYMKNIEEKGAYFLNKMSLQFKVYDIKKKKEIDFRAIHKKMKQHNLMCIEKEVVVGSQEKLPCRIIISKAPQDVYKSRIDQAEKKGKKRGYQLSKSYKERASMNIYLTNASQESLPKESIMDIYRIRWQVELMFKVWKSLTNINKLHKVKMVRFEVQLMAKLIWILTNWKVFFLVNHWVHQINRKHMCSIWKFFKQIISNTHKLRDILWQDGDLNKWLTMLFSKARRHLLIEKKKGKLAFYEHFNLITHLA